jgi:Family of unknown function (DUF6283)
MSDDRRIRGIEADESRSRATLAVGLPPGTISVMRWPERYRGDPHVWAVVLWRSGPIAYVRLGPLWESRGKAEEIAATFRAGKRRRSVAITAVKMAGPDHAVLTVKGGGAGYRREPCGGCPWRVDQIGAFPAEAFRHSANTAEDMAQHAFSCHESGAEKPATCAGFLLRGALHNMLARLRWGRGDWAEGLSDGGHELFRSYRAMAEANGVAADDPALARCHEP